MPSERPEVREIIRWWGFAVLLWSPVILHATGTLADVLLLFSRTTEQMLSVLGNPAAIIAESVGSSSPPQPEQTPKPTPSPPSEPGAIVAVGVAQLLASGVIILFMIILTFGGVLLSGVYLACLVGTLIRALMVTRAYLAFRGDAVAE